MRLAGKGTSFGTVTFEMPGVAKLQQRNFWLPAVVYVFIEANAWQNHRTWKTQFPPRLTSPA